MRPKEMGPPLPHYGIRRRFNSWDHCSAGAWRRSTAPSLWARPAFTSDELLSRITDDVAIPESLPGGGVILADQVRSRNWRARNASKLCQIPSDLIQETLAKLRTLL